MLGLSSNNSKKLVVAMAMVSNAKSLLRHHGEKSIYTLAHTMFITLSLVERGNGPVERVLKRKRDCRESLQKLLKLYSSLLSHDLVIHL